MATPIGHQAFDQFHARVSQFDVSGKTLLIPDMAPFGARLIAGCFRAFGVDAIVMDTYKGLASGKQFTSGKECFPCQVTLGDILHHLQKEQDRLGDTFSPGKYVYFLPEADGPCRFGMYTKMQRLILDRFPQFRDVPIVYLSTGDAYATSGLLPEEHASSFRKLSYIAVIIADVLDRIVWRVRPYERHTGMTDACVDEALKRLVAAIESTGANLDFNRLHRMVEEVAVQASSFLDPDKPRRPRIGIVGEIYLRSHPDSNQNIIRCLEDFGGEVVDASLGEWVNFVTYERIRKTRRHLKLAWREKNHAQLRQAGRQLLDLEIERLYQFWRQGQVYRRVLAHLDIQPDHRIGTIEKRLENDHLFNFDIGTEAALSIGGALEYVHDGFDGIVNVFPFTCMPSTICAAVLKPLLHEQGIPYLDAPYDGTYQPNREVALRTFMYQAKQHMEARTAGENGRAKSWRIRH